MLLTIDYRNAFRTHSHNFFKAALTFFSLPPTFVNLVMSSLRSQYHFLVGSVAIREVTFYQEAGIGQGDPFSPQLFSFCAAIIIYPLRHLRVKIGMYLYVYDFLITFGQETTKQLLKEVLHELRRFSAVGGLQQNIGKLACVTKGTLQPEALQLMQDLGLQHETKVRYLGVQMGHMSVKEAFVGPLREAYRRARIAATIALSIPEKITLLKTWILPTLLLTARAYVADRPVVSALNTTSSVLRVAESQPTSFPSTGTKGGTRYPCHKHGSLPREEQLQWQRRPPPQLCQRT